MLTFSINIKNQLRSIRSVLFYLALIPVTLGLLHLRGKITFHDYPGALLICSSIYFFFILPALFVHLNYYIQNANTVMTINFTTNLITITRPKKQTSFYFRDIQIVERHIAIYNRNRIDHNGRSPTPWVNYGYLKLKLKTGEIFYLTSLMLDMSKPPFEVHLTRFRFVPFVNKRARTITGIRTVLEVESNEKLLHFKDLFADYSADALQEKINDPGRYEPEAIAAAKELLDAVKLKNDYNT